MVFSSLIFLYLFLPLNLLLYFASKKIQWRNGVLICFSLIFYAWGEPVWIFMLLFASAADYLFARAIDGSQGTPLAKVALAGSLVMNLGMLVFFKYTGFLVENLNQLTGLRLPVPEIALPIGISFYVFQSLSYILDVYRGTVGAQTCYPYHLMYIMSFHQLVAGPIVRYSDVAREIRHRVSTPGEIQAGLTRFLTGLVKKVVVANHAGSLAAQFLDGNLAQLSTPGAWFGLILFTIQIYYDFSGYSDMAIGLGLCCGFHYLENFNYPYISRSVTQFWRRWHISLSSFFRDYVYIPLGGNRRHQIFNLAVVWMLTGLWHGASWNFLLWGLYYGVLLVVEKLFLGKALAKLPVLSNLYLLLVVTIGWGIFYFTDLGRLGQFMTVLFGGGGPVESTLRLTFFNNLFWLVGAIFFCMPVVPAFQRLLRRAGPAVQAAAGWGQIVLNVGMLAVSTLLLVGQSYNPFLYFRF